MEINKNNLFYRNRKAIQALCKEHNVDVGVGTEMWIHNNGIKHTPAEKEEWRGIMRWYQQHKTLTLADLFK